MVMGLDGGTCGIAQSIGNSCSGSWCKTNYKLQLALSKELGLMVCTVLNTPGDCINHPPPWLGTWPFLLDKATVQILHSLLKEHPFDDLEVIQCLGFQTRVLLLIRRA